METFFWVPSLVHIYYIITKAVFFEYIFSRHPWARGDPGVGAGGGQVHACCVAAEVGEQPQGGVVAAGV
jgi:hypothetical protein